MTTFETLTAILVERIAASRMSPDLIDGFVHGEASILSEHRRAELVDAVHAGLVDYAAQCGISAIDYRAAQLAMNTFRHVGNRFKP